MAEQNKQSLTRRIVLLSSAWTALAIILLGWLLMSQFRQGAERNFADLQKAQLFSLIGAIGLDEQGAFTGAPNLGDQNFIIPNSGWFWRVESLETQSPQSVASLSLSDLKIERPTAEAVPFDARFERSFVANGPEGRLIRVLETEIQIADDQIAVFQVGANLSEFNNNIRSLALRIAGLLAVFGTGVVLINVAILLFGLRPLDHIRGALSDIRASKAEKLEGDFPTELTPMVSEMNTLIENNKRIVERARTQVGNLAHSLKTPIAVLLNEARAERGVDPSIVRTQSENMQSQVQHYLDRARIAAQQGSLSFRTDAIETCERLVRVMRKLHPHIDIDLNTPNGASIFAGEKEDLDEVLGNILENATKWSAGKVNVALARDSEMPDKLQLIVEDDGPGIDEADYERALKRGQRLDEKVQGTGLGLSIVNDTVEAYGGSVTLAKSTLGGLKVSVVLPSVAPDQSFR